MVLITIGSGLSLVFAYQYVWKTELNKKEAGLRISPLIEGDINTDGKVDQNDLGMLATAYGSTPTEPNWNLSADINGNKIVEVQDLFVIGTNYGKP
jgi:hypothetical protein